MPNSGDTTDTIAAISSALGRGALSIVRLSGPGVREIARQMLTPFPRTIRRATLAVARDPVSGVVLDQLVAVRYDAPSSYTGESMLELTCHGGLATSRGVLSSCLALGARAATAGEFTRRALLNGKLDLAQAEGLPDLIDASSEPMRRVALGIVGGSLSRVVARLRATLLELEAVMAYSVDFPEEDEGEVPLGDVLAMADAVRKQLAMLIETADRGSIIREGALIVFAGAPNVGKSSLFNALLGHDRAIVTEIPGTTRDAIEHPSIVCSWPVRLVDTAGLRRSDDVLERLGIEVSERYIKDADVGIVCGDGTTVELDDMARKVRGLGAEATLCVQTKLDLREHERIDDGTVWVSAKTGAGLRELREAVAAVLDARYGRLDYEHPVITQARHKEALVRASHEVARFTESLERGVTTALAMVHIRASVIALEEIIGAVSVDDLLDQIFTRFCVGK